MALTTKPKCTDATKSAAIANSRWLAYATAGAASAFTCANSAEASIHYSGPINRLFNECYEIASYRLDRPGDFIRLKHSSIGCTRGYPGTAFFYIGGLVKASIAGFYSSCFSTLVSASNLERGEFISNRPFVPAQPGRSALLARDNLCSGQFGETGIGCIGFKFNNGSGDQYGWGRVRMRGNSYHQFKLRDFAYVV